MASSLPDALLQIDALRQEIDAMRPLPDDVAGRAAQRLTLEWTFHSNAIEGNSLDYGETRALLMHGVTAHGKPLKDHLDIRRHREVIEYLEAMVRDREPVTQATLRELHRQLMGETYEVKAQTPDGGWITREERGGDYKAHPNHVRTATGETHYYATPEETPARMTDLMDAFTRLQAEVEADDTHPLVAAATLHHGLVEIHPFADGNGRLARVLMNLLLMRAGFPPAVIRTEHRDAYYGALAEADAGNTEPFIAFVADELAATMALYLRALRGEPDPDAFSKRVALLHREAVAATREHPLDREAKSILSINFVIPLIEETSRRVDEIGKFFSYVEPILLVVDSLGQNRVFDQGKEYLMSGDWVSFNAIWQLKGLRLNPSNSISISYLGICGDFDMSLTTSPSRSKSKYSHTPSESYKEVQILLDRSFGPVISMIEQAISRSKDHGA